MRCKCIAPSILHVNNVEQHFCTESLHPTKHWYVELNLLISLQNLRSPTAARLSKQSRLDIHVLDIEFCNL